MDMPGRKTEPIDNYKYSFNGKLDDKSDGWQTQDYGFRAYDYRLGRFISQDPLANKYSFKTPYDFAENDVIRAVDLDGLEKYVVVKLVNQSGRVLVMRIIRHIDGKQIPLDLLITDNNTGGNPNGYNQQDIAVITFSLDGAFTVIGKKDFDKTERTVLLNKNPYDNSGKLNSKNYNPHTEDTKLPKYKSPYQDGVIRISNSSLNVDGVHSIANMQASYISNRKHTTYFDATFNFRAGYNQSLENLFTAIWAVRPTVTSNPANIPTNPTPPVIDGVQGPPRGGPGRGGNNQNE